MRTTQLFSQYEFPVHCIPNVNCFSFFQWWIFLNVFFFCQVSGIPPSDTATPPGTPTVRAPNGEDTDAPDELHEPPSLELGEEEGNTVGDPPPPEVVEKDLPVVEILGRFFYEKITFFVFCY